MKRKKLTSTQKKKRRDKNSNLVPRQKDTKVEKNLNISYEMEKALLIQVYGRIQRELIDLNLLEEEGGDPIKMSLVRKRGVIYEELVFLYNEVSMMIYPLSEDDLHKFRLVGNDYCKKLINTDIVVSDLLLCMYLFSEYIIYFKSGFRANMTLPKIQRNIDFFYTLNVKPFKNQNRLKIRSLAPENISYWTDIKIEDRSDVMKASKRVSDNLFRMFTGQEQKTDEKVSDFIKNIREKARLKYGD